MSAKADATEPKSEKESRMAFPSTPETAKKVTGFARRYAKLLSLTWRSLKESKLGIVGLGVIIMFGVMAMLAPVISPYKPTFLAPDQDVFEIKNYTRGYDTTDHYNVPVIGPTTPTYNTINGGLWLIVSSEEGRIYMDYMKTSFTNQTPFEAGNSSLQINITDLGLQPPLTHLQYVCPGRDVNSAAGERDRNGLLIFMANTTFAVVNPFGAQGAEVILTRDLGFSPTWVVQDPVSSGEMYTIPLQQAIYAGVVKFKFGPYRYFVMANGTHLTMYRMEYLWNDPLWWDQVRNRFTQMLDVNMTITSEPLPYSNIEYSNSSCLVVPTVNRLDVYYLNGTLRSSLPLSLDGEPANVSAPMAYARTTYPPLAFVPMKSASGAALGFLSLLNDTFYTAYQIPAPGATINIGAAPSKEQNVLVAADLPSPNENGALTVIYRLTFAGQRDENFVGEVDERIVHMFYVTEVSKVFALADSGKIYAGSMTSSGSARVGILVYFGTGPETKYLEYAGTFSGTKYGSMSTGEVNGLYFDSATGEVTLFQFIGTIKAPLPPGKYASGNTYYLGTDNVGHDILTHLIYGSRIAFIVGVLSAFFAVFFGTLMGLISGYYGGWTDTLLMRFTDIILVLPTLPIVLILAAILGPNIWNIILIIALLGWPGIARVIRAQTLSLKERPFIDAARVGGSSDTKIIIKHIAPNVLPFTFLYMTLLVAGAIITEAALSFLGLGDPKAVTWGIMLSTIQTSGNTLSAWWWLLPPGLAITVLSLGFYLVGRAVDEMVNPRLRRR